MRLRLLAAGTVSPPQAWPCTPAPSKVPISMEGSSIAQDLKASLKHDTVVCYHSVLRWDLDIKCFS